MPRARRRPTRGPADVARRLPPRRPPARRHGHGRRHASGHNTSTAARTVGRRAPRRAFHPLRHRNADRRRSARRVHDRPRLRIDVGLRQPRRPRQDPSRQVPGREASCGRHRSPRPGQPLRVPRLPCAHARAAHGHPRLQPRLLHRRHRPQAGRGATTRPRLAPGPRRGPTSRRALSPRPPPRRQAREAHDPASSQAGRRGRLRHGQDRGHRPPVHGLPRRGPLPATSEKHPSHRQLCLRLRGASYPGRRTRRSQTGRGKRGSASQLHQHRGGPGVLRVEGHAPPHPTRVRLRVSQRRQRQQIPLGKRQHGVLSLRLVGRALFQPARRIDEVRRRRSTSTDVAPSGPSSAENQTPSS